MIETILTLDDERVAVYARLTEAQMRNRLHPEQGMFVAESPKVIKVALSAGYKPLSMLCERRHISGDAAEIITANPGMQVYTGERELLERLTGYTLTRGVLCAMRRPAAKTPDDICRGATRVAVIDEVTDTTNIGAIFRSAAALGIDAVLLSPTAAMALSENSVPIDDPALAARHRLAIILGTEGEGLPQNIIDRADYVARIPMSHGVDSLNVAAASAVAFWQLRDRKHSVSQK